MSQTIHFAPRQDLQQQCTLAGLLSFTAAGSVYFSMIASLSFLFSVFPEEPRWWPVCVTVPTAWYVLWLLYRRWDLREVLRVHYTGPVLALIVDAAAAFFGLVALATQGLPEARQVMDFLTVVLVVILAGCGLSVAVSLPAATLMLAYLFYLRPREKNSADA